MTGTRLKSRECGDLLAGSRIREILARGSADLVRFSLSLLSLFFLSGFLAYTRVRFFFFETERGFMMLGRNIV